MATRKKGTNKQDILRYEKLSDSALWKHIGEHQDLEVRALSSNVSSVAEQAAHLLDRVAKSMPLYTLHNERHIRNIIGWMERLLGGQDGIKQLSPLECALAILSAYTHDLGMTLTLEEQDDYLNEHGTSPRRKEYIKFRNGFPDEIAQIEAMRQQGAHQLAQKIETDLLTDFLRKTHSDTPARRLRSRIDAMPQHLFTYRGVSFRHELEQIAISHNHSAHWLRTEALKDRYRTDIGNGEPVNYAFVALLLRLADIMDFDASRTPTILFHHLGLADGPASHFEELSRKEWLKHLSITGFRWPANGALEYIGKDCPHPAIEKSVHDFIGWIKEEVAAAHTERDQILNDVSDQGRCILQLPENVEAKIQPALDKNRKPVYEYHNWTFQLDQQEIIQLLMGEKLYGNPSLCIRELLQNSLDALELREMRLRSRLQYCRPDGEPDEARGFFKHNGQKQRYEVLLTWGETSEGKFIRVEDNGVGMTKDTIERFFTRIGKSYYKSPEFHREQANLREKELILSPISQFGIGVLSCFMIADRVSVSTHPGKENGAPTDLEISGPGSLFWSKPGTRPEQGTTITLWLKKRLHDKEVQLAHDWDTCLDQLRRHFKYPAAKNERKYPEGTFDPLMIAAQHVVWPRYPVRVAPPAGTERVIDDTFHFAHLMRMKAIQWGLDPTAVENPRWDFCDWRDEQDPQATGTRIRLWFPRFDGAESKEGLPSSTNHLPFYLLAALAETGLSSDFDSRVFTLCQGMHVPDRKSLLPVIPTGHAVGCGVWFDFRGPAAPALKVDRSECISPSRPSEWETSVNAIWKRWLYWVSGQVQSQPEVVGPLLHYSWRNRDAVVEVAKPAGGPAVLPPVWLLHTEAVVQAFAFALDFDLARAFARARALDRALALDRARAFALARAFDRDFALDLALDRARDLGSLTTPVDPQLLQRALFEILQHAFFPNLTRSWPPLNLFTLQNQIGDASLLAPATFEFTNQQDPEKLSPYQFDLCFPMSSIPLARLRKACPKWRDDRSLRPVATLPFLYPDASQVWAAHAGKLPEELQNLKYLYAFAPADTHWYKPFADWTPEDFQNPDHQSILWKIPTREILIAHGAVPLTEIKQKGLPYEAFRNQTPHSP